MNIFRILLFLILGTKVLGVLTFTIRLNTMQKCYIEFLVNEHVSDVFFLDTSVSFKIYWSCTVMKVLTNTLYMYFIVRVLSQTRHNLVINRTHKNRLVTLLKHLLINTVCDPKSSTRLIFAAHHEV